MRPTHLLSIACAITSIAGAANAGVIYDSLHETPNSAYFSLGFRYFNIREFGDRVNLAGTDRQLTTATFTLSNYARVGMFQPGGAEYQQGQWAGTGWNQSFTLRFYDGASGSTPGNNIATVTQTIFVPYAPNGTYGWGQNISFTNLNITLPDTVVWSLSFDTYSFGYNPTGVWGPADFLGLAINTDAGGGVRTGSTNLNSVFIDSARPDIVATTNVFREDFGWTGYNGMARFDAVPSPGALALMGIAAAAGRRRRR